MRTLETLDFAPGFATLPAAFHTPVMPRPLAGGNRLAALSLDLCRLLDLDPVEARRPEFRAVFGGKRLLPGMAPTATCYAGYQFGHYVPQLGDGRAILLGELRDAAGDTWEVQLKGSGQTAFSRAGDGRAVLRSSVREFLCSEAMAALGIPTTRALCLIHGDEEVYRERIETGAILTRLAPSHLRFGHFEVFYYRGQFDHLAELGHYALRRYFPELSDSATPFLDLLRETVRRSARLVAQWQLVGFAHGVLNTDNMSLLGLTIDYGPFGFLDAYAPGFICNHSDHWGRYAFDQQPDIFHWNLSRFAQALLPLIDPEDGAHAAELATDVLRGFVDEFSTAYHAGLAAKLGLAEARPEDADLAYDLLRRMAEQQVDYTNLFRALARMPLHRHDATDSPQSGPQPVDLFRDRDAFASWALAYRARLLAEGADDARRAARMNRVNPKYILRNYLAQNAIAAAEAGDYSEIERLARVLSAPFDEQPEAAAYATEPPDWGRHLTVSCSS